MVELGGGGVSPVLFEELLTLKGQWVQCLHRHSQRIGSGMNFPSAS